MGGILCVLTLVACSTPTPDQARATATVTGCWPYGAVQPETPTAYLPTPGTPVATLVASYVACTPEAGRPTATIRPTRTPVPRPPPTRPPAPVMNEREVIGQQPGKNTGLQAAILPSGRSVAGWINWGWQPDGAADGQVWVRVQRGQTWRPAQGITREDAPVRGDVGGIGIAITSPVLPTAVDYRRTLARIGVYWGDGRNTLYESVSSDEGATWGGPVAISTAGYQILAAHGGDTEDIHVLALTPSPHRLRYLTRARPGAPWQVFAIATPGDVNGAGMGIVVTPTGIQRIVVARMNGAVVILTSADGSTWTPRAVPLGQFMAEPNPDKVSIVAAERRGSGAVMVLWSQYSAGGAFSMTSLDAGVTWSGVERVAQHTPDGSCSAGQPCAYFPAGAYDKPTDSIVVSWVEITRGMDAPQRVRYASKNLTTGIWRDVVAPVPVGTIRTQQPPALSPQGYEGKIVGRRDGFAGWVILLDRRNEQYRIETRRIELPALTGAPES